MKTLDLHETVAVRLPDGRLQYAIVTSIVATPNDIKIEWRHAADDPSVPNRTETVVKQTTFRITLESVGSPFDWSRYATP